MNFKHTLFLLLLVFISQLSSAQIDLDDLHSYIEQSRKDWNVPGMAVGIVKDGEIIFTHGFGVKELDGKDPVDEHTLFAIASNTKAFISSSLGQLVSDGKINWDDNVRDYIPYFQLYDHYASNETTIRDLLCHRVGLGTFSGDLIWYKSNYSVEEVIKRIKFVPKRYGFRAGYGYSNLMFITAGEVINQVSGTNWDKYIKKNIFQPLEMDRTITSTSLLEKTHNFAVPHKSENGRNKAIPWVNWDNMGAAGGVISSVHDMSKWLNMNLQHGIIGNDTLLDPVQQNILWTPHNYHIVSKSSKARIPGRHFSGYGLGWGLSDYFGRMMVSHGGGYDGMYSRVVLIPDEKLGIVILTNSMSGISTPLSYYIINQFIKEDLRDWSKDFLPPDGQLNSVEKRIEKAHANRNPNTKTSLDLKNYCGSYFANLYGDIEVRWENDTLRLIFPAAPLLSASLKHWQEDSFEIVWDQVHAWFGFGTVQFELNASLNITGMRIDVPNYDIFFDELDITKKD